MLNTTVRQLAYGKEVQRRSKSEDLPKKIVYKLSRDKAEEHLRKDQLTIAAYLFNQSLQVFIFRRLKYN